MPIRISGMNSGLDTEALVSELVSAYSKKTDKYVKAQTKVAWKQEAWQTMSARTSTFRKSLDSLRFSSAYKLKTTSISNSSKATVTAGNNAVNGTQTLKISKLAKSGYLTGGKLDTNREKVTSSTTLGDLGLSEEGTVSLNGKEITLSKSTTIKEAVTAFKDAGVDASFDEANQRIFISARASGKENDFSLYATNKNGAEALKKLGLYVKSNTANSVYTEWSKKYGTYKNETISDSTELSPELFTELENLLKTYNTNANTLADADDALAHLTKAQDYIIAKNDVANTDATLKDLVDHKDKLITSDGTTYTYNKDETTGEEYYTKDGEPVADGAEPTRYYLTTETTSRENDQPVLDDEGNPVMEDVTTRYLKAGGSEDKIDVQTADEYLQGLGDEGAKAVSKYRTAKATMEKIQAEAAAEGTSEAAGDTMDVHNLSSILAKIDASDASVAEAAEQQISDALNKYGTKRDDAQKALDDNALLADYAKRYAAAEEANDDKTKGLIVAQLKEEIAYANSMTAADAKPDYTGDAVRIDGEDAEISLNGAKFTSTTNSFSINGLTINAMALTDENETLSITTATDNQGIYDKIKDFLSEYNSLINAMTSSYNAENTSSYEPLTDDEKDAMSDKEIEKWEEKGKSGILRRDTTLSTLMSAMTGVMSKSYTIDGKTYALSSFGIKTLGILNSGKNEQNAYHIDGDADDDSTASNTDKLMAAIASDPDGVTKFFQKLASDLYDKLGENMTSTSLRSYGTFYNDKEMAKEYSDYTKTISRWEEKVADIEDSYYKKFAAMESALAELQSQTSQLSGLLGM